MRRANNYSTLTDPDKGVLERDGFVCGHCQRIVLIQPKQLPEDLGGLCKVCDGLICPRCYDNRMRKGVTCKTWQAQFDEMEARDRLLRQVGV